MKYDLHIRAGVWMLLMVLPFSAVAQLNPEELVEGREWERRAQTGMKFLTISLDPRAAALADAVTAHEGNSVAMFYNPAGMGTMTNTLHAGFGRVEWIGDIDYNYGSVAYRPSNGQYGVFGLHVLSVTYGEIQQTIRFANEQGYQDIGTYSPSGTAVGLSYGRTVTDRFSLGGTAKYVSQSLGEAILSFDGGAVGETVSKQLVAFDFGVLYRTGFRSLNLAVSARNFSQEVTYAEESFELPLTLRMGVAMDVLDFTSVDQNTHSLLVSVDALRPRDFDEQLKAGAEYVIMNTVALRAGYTFPTDEEGINLGAGIRGEFSGFAVTADYAYSAMDIFGDTNRIALKMGF